LICVKAVDAMFDQYVANAIKMPSLSPLRFLLPDRLAQPRKTKVVARPWNKSAVVAIYLSVSSLPRERTERRTAMPRKTKTETDNSQSQPTEQLQQMAAANSAAMEIFAQACQAYAAGVAELNGELMGFVTARIDRDVKLGQALSSCQNWSDVVDLQQQWAQQATQEYLTEAGRVTDLASRLVKESWEPVYDRANQVLSKTGPSGE
jgi:hypothetical protein